MWISLEGHCGASHVKSTAAAVDQEECKKASLQLQQQTFPKITCNTRGSNVN